MAFQCINVQVFGKGELSYADIEEQRRWCTHHHTHALSESSVHLWFVVYLYVILKWNVLWSGGWLAWEDLSPGFRDRRCRSLCVPWIPASAASKGDPRSNEGNPHTLLRELSGSFSPGGIYHYLFGGKMKSEDLPNLFF